MNGNTNYQKVIRVLKKNPPVLRDKESLTDSIMRGITPFSRDASMREQAASPLFGWVHLFWVRGVMTLAAACFMGLFIAQQFMIANRLNDLERQLVRTVPSSMEGEEDLGILPAVFFNVMFKNLQQEDSVQVSRADLELLLNNYREMMNKQSVTMPEEASGSSYNWMQRQRIKSDTKNNNSL